MFRNKKGDAQFLVVLIIVITSFLLIAGTIFRFMSTANDKEAEALCKDSVALRNAAAITSGDKNVKGSPILCKTLDKKIKGTKEQVQSQLTQSMARCWEMFGEGKYKDDLFSNLNLFTGDNKCFVCYAVIIEKSNDFSEKESISTAEFYQYLRETPYPKKKDQTYLDYFQYGGGNGRVIGIFNEEGIKPGNAYAIAFKSKSNKAGWFQNGLTIGGTVVAVGGAVLLTVGTGGLGLLAITSAGAATSFVGTSEYIKSSYFREVDLDSIVIVDMSSDVLGNFFKDQCNYVGDIAGK